MPLLYPAFLSRQTQYTLAGLGASGQRGHLRGFYSVARTWVASVVTGRGAASETARGQDRRPRRPGPTLIVERAGGRGLEVSCRRWTAVARSRRCWRCWSPRPAAGATAAVTTVIGSGSAGFSDQQVNNPYGVVLGPDGALVFCDLDNQRIRRLDLRTRRTTTIAGNGQKGYAGDGGPAIDAALNMPHEAVFDGRRGTSTSPSATTTSSARWTRAPA